MPHREHGSKEAQNADHHEPHHGGHGGEGYRSERDRARHERYTEDRGSAEPKCSEDEPHTDDRVSHEISPSPKEVTRNVAEAVTTVTFAIYQDAPDTSTHLAVPSSFAHIREDGSP